VPSCGRAAVAQVRDLRDEDQDRQRVGQEYRGGAAVLVSNNRYRLGRPVGSGTRPRMDDGVLGITVVGAPTGRGEGGRSPQPPWREWSVPAFEVDSPRPVPAGIDGEALVLDAPLRFHIRPGVLRVRVARQHPGASPSAMAPEGLWAGAAGLLRIALGRPERPPTPTQGRRDGPDADHREGAAHL
jgi:hypothetical protein